MKFLFYFMNQMKNIFENDILNHVKDFFESCIFKKCHFCTQYPSWNQPEILRATSRVQNRPMH